MGGGAGAPARAAAASWRALGAAVLALWLVPAALALALLWLPPLCCAVAAVRFRRARSERLVAAAARGSRGGDRSRDDDDEEEEAAVDARDRVRLLHRYLHDQMELVASGSEEAGGHQSPAVAPGSDLHPTAGNTVD